VVEIETPEGRGANVEPSGAPARPVGSEKEVGTARGIGAGARCMGGGFGAVMSGMEIVKVLND
jgi:hypothetical protein